MKSTLQLAPKTNPDENFPVLARLKTEDGAEGTIVLFYSACRGIVVIPPKNNYYQVGYNSVDWVNVCDKLTWDILPKGSSVTLIQE